MLLKSLSLKLDFDRVLGLNSSRASTWLKALQDAAISGGLQRIQEIVLEGMHLDATQLDVKEILSFVKNQETVRSFRV